MKVQVRFAVGNLPAHEILDYDPEKDTYLASLIQAGYVVEIPGAEEEVLPPELVVANEKRTKVK